MFQKYLRFIIAFCCITCSHLVSSDFLIKSIKIFTHDIVFILKYLLNITYINQCYPDYSLKNTLPENVKMCGT